MTSNLVAARSGDRRKALEALRDSLAADLDACVDGTKAQLAAQYIKTLADLGALEQPSVKRGTVDELRDRRARKGRGSAANASANP